jgi:GNAT superfamily N-acetyltransferase
VTPDILIRPAGAADLPVIIALYADDILGQSREVPDAQIADEYTKAFDAIQRDPNHFLVVVETEGGVVGTLLLSFLPGLSRRGAWRAQIEAMRVARSRRGQGLGQVMLDWVEQQARARGCDLIQLTSDRVRVDAHRFYERAGFEPTHIGFKRVLR